MPTTPQVNFNFKNENVQVSVPQLGISHFLARTTKGPFNDPSVIISSYPQFQRLFGEEIVPDGTISNIKKALQMGSRIRVSRVAGSAASYGYAKKESSVQTFSMVFTSTISSETVTLSFKLRSKEQGSKFEDIYDTIYLKFTSNTSGPNTKIILTQASDSDFGVNSVIDARTFISWNSAGGVNYKALQEFVEQAPNITVEVSGNFNDTPLDIQGVVAWLSQHTDFVPATSFVTTDSYTLESGSDGGASTANTWDHAYDAISEYTDGYHIIPSHIHQHIPSNTSTALATIAAKVKAAKEAILFVELPKPTANQDTEAYLTALSTLVGAVGQSKYIAYYGGGIKYYDELGVIRNCDVMGTVAGLHDVCASQYGPWYSPAGQNRGIVTDALGPVMKNLGTPSQLANLQSFADWYMNLFVIKDTQYAGKRTMLWHNFTSNPIQDSEKFISIVNLNLFLKKNLRPILESYIEEPNTFSTWKNIYYQVKPLLDDLVNRNAFTNPQWLGDQDAQSYADLQINNEADVRAGKYKVVLQYRDIVTMQEITLDIIINAAEQSISITSNE